MGFKSRVAKTIDEVNLSEIANVKAEIIDLEALKAAGIINSAIRQVKVILSGELTVPVKLKGLRVTKGARKVIEDLGGSVEE
jgi:large subunit ribosomal protein L15